MISVITPLFNGKKYIIETLESVRNQTCENWEMLIIDDASTDEGPGLVEDYLHVKADERIRLLKNEKNIGAVGSRNRGLSEARGQYICFLDSDDLWDPEKLERQLAYLKEKKTTDPHAGFVFSQCRIIDGEGRETGQIRRVDEVVDYKKLLKDNQIPCLTVLIDRQEIPTESIQMPDIGHEDYAAWLNILKDGHKAYGLREVLAGYRVNASSLSGNKKTAARWHYEVLKSQQLSHFSLIYYMICYVIAAINKRM